MTGRKVRVYAPATISNLGSGFDVLGIAIDAPGDIVVAERRKGQGLLFAVRSGGETVPADPGKNVAAYVARLMLDRLGVSFGVQLTLHKKMPIGSGLGSSAASSVAAAVAVNALLPRPMPKMRLLPFILEGERLASGSAHADNAAPSLLGGGCLIRSYSPLDVVRIPVSSKLVWVVVHPHLVVRTAIARRVLPLSVPLRKAIRQWGNVGGLTFGLVSGDARLVGKCVEDLIAEPVRARFVRGFYAVKEAAIEAGAPGCTLSGSGPSVFAVASSERSAMRIGRAIRRAFAETARVQSDVFVSRVNREGATVEVLER